MFGISKYNGYDKEDFVSADDLSRSIEDLIDKCERHMGYIESALHEAKSYASGLRGEEIPTKLFDEGMSFVSMADGDMSSFDNATEVALNLRRAGDVSLNNHYG